MAATPQYYAWNNAGRPLNPSRPIRDIVDRMRLAFPKGAAAHLFSWYADDAHYQASNPQDHTPYSYTPWPVTPNPYPYVFATDIMHRPDLDVDCDVLFAYWIGEARAGRMPWLKYLIWEGRSYDVRTGWVGKAATGHFDHIHISVRTDYRDVGLGSWVLVPGSSPTEEAEMYCNYGDSNSNNVETLQWTLFEVFQQNLGTSGSAGNGVDRSYGNRVGAGLATVLGYSDGTAVIDGATRAILKTYGPKEVSRLADKVAKLRAGQDGGGGGVTEAQCRTIATEVSRAQLAMARIVPGEPEVIGSPTSTTTTTTTTTTTDSTTG